MARQYRARNYTSEEIMAKCPETIDKKKISTKKVVHKTGKWYKEEDRIRAACLYAVVGSAAEVSRITGIRSDVIRHWKMQPWWPQVIDRIRSEHDDQLDVKFTRIIDKTVEEINDRLEKGDYIYDSKTGEFHRKPMGGKEMAVVTSIFVDKRAMLREKKHVRAEETAVMDRLKKLASEFEGFIKAKDVTPNKKDITDVEDTEQEPASAGEDGRQEALLRSSEQEEALLEPSVSDEVLSEVLDSDTVPKRDHSEEDDWSFKDDDPEFTDGSEDSDPPEEPVEGSRAQP